MIHDISDVQEEKKKGGKRMEIGRPLNEPSCNN